MSKMNQKCKGARDLLPEEMGAFRHIENIFMETCLKWGYQEVRTPTLEYLHLFTSSGTLSSDMINRVYSFLDWDGWSGERVVLRPDGTIPVTRLYLENLADKKSAKLFYVTNVFLFESTGKENRERWQCGVEYFGNDKPTSDLETIILAIEVLKKLGIQTIHIKLSHAGLVKSILKDFKMDINLEEKMITEIKNGNWNDAIKMFKKGSPEFELLSMLTGIKGKSTGYLDNIKALHNISRETKKNIDSMATITRQLDSLNIPYRIDIASTRNFEYYTGLCFQLFSKSRLLGAGGRYNNLVPLMGGKHVPACGMALYVDEIIKLISLKDNTISRIAIICPEEHNFDISSLCDLTNSLSDSGYIVEFGQLNKKESYRWIITINSESELVDLLDTGSGQKRTARSIKSIIQSLERNK
jgi:histidyl-tRNA synthetase